MAYNTESTFAKALTKKYKMGLKEIGYPETPFLSMIKKDTSFGGDKDVSAILYQGLNASTSFQVAMNRRGTLDPEAFELDVVEAYGIASVTNKALLKARKSPEAMGVLMDMLVQSATLAFWREATWRLWGNGGGAIGKIATVSTSTITLTSANDARHFQVGQTIETSTADGTSGSVKATVADGAKIVKIDRDLGTLTCTGNWSDYIPTIANDDFIFNEGDFGHNCFGVGIWIPETTPTGSFAGVDRSKDPVRTAGTRHSANGADVEDALIDFFKKLNRNGGRGADTVFLDPEKFAEFQKIAAAKSYPIVQSNTDIKHITFKGYEIPTANGSAKVMLDPECPSTAALATKMSNWTMISMGETPHWEQQSGDKVLVEVAADAKQLRLKGYYQFKCENPVDSGRLIW